MLGAVVRSVPSGLKRETHPSEVADLIRRDEGQELQGRPQAVSLGAPQIHPDWRALDSEESVMGSLLALNARLMFYEERKQAG